MPLTRTPTGSEQPLTLFRTLVHSGKFLPLCLLLGAALFLESCGGGPTVATSTGRILYLGTTSGLFGYSIQSDNTLKPLSSSALVPGSWNQIAVTPETPTGSASPLLLAVTSGTATSISNWTLNSDGTINAAGTAISLSACTSFSSVTGIAAVPGSQYVLAVDGTSSTHNIATISLATGNACTTASTSSNYPIQPALDCAVPGSSSSNCILFLTLSSTAASSATPAPPMEENWSSGNLSTLSPPATPFTCTSPNCPLGVAFNSSTLYFYATFNSTTPPSLQSIAPGSASATSSTSFSASTPLNYPCVDILGGTTYIPTANGYLYAVSTGSGGSLGGPGTVLSPGSTGTSGTLNMTSCAVSSNP